MSGVIPDHAHRPRGRADRDPREVVPGEAVVAGDERRLERGDVNRLGGCRARARRGRRQRQAGEGDEVHHVLGCFSPAVKEAGHPVVLEGNIKIACLRVYGWVCALVLTEVRIAGSDDEVRRSGRTGPADASIASVMTGRSCRAAQVADSSFDHAAKAGARAKLGVGHVQPATSLVDREEILVQEAAEGEAVDGLAIRTDRGHDRLPAGERCRRTRSGHLAGRYGQRILGDIERDEDVADVEVGRAAGRVRLDAGIAFDQGRGTVGIRQAAQVGEGLPPIG